MSLGKIGGTDNEFHVSFDCKISESVVTTYVSETPDILTVVMSISQLTTHFLA